MPVLPYEIWEVPADVFLSNGELRYYGSSSRKVFSELENHLRNNKTILVSASPSFVREGEVFVPASSILSDANGETLYHEILSSGRFPRDWLDQMKVFDYIIGNIDRHTSNFGYLLDSQGQVLAHPFFDHGQSFFSVFDDGYLENDDDGERFTCYRQKPYNTSFHNGLLWIDRDSIVRSLATEDLELRIRSVIDWFRPILGNIRTQKILELVERRLGNVRKFISSSL
ncbi:hypothetical protein CGZ75_05380 [Paenibacillus herberti]|uniref:HipA-like C-terminal domain-containing protein n=2 Tax=Paenibacillus herberti TaxID=1619309 RepID=A0A229P2M8_9BACL|nr:hypothetical protein CGZ75_05380 [Paenibacillus herberti]